MNPIKKWLFIKFLRWYLDNIKDHKLAKVPIDQHIIMDETFAALWNKTEGQEIRDTTQKINDIINNPRHPAFRNEQLRHDFMSKVHDSIVRKYNDQSLDPRLYFEPQDVRYKKDRITFDGVSLIWSRFAGSSEVGPTHLAVGHGTSPTTDDMSALEFENAIESLTGNASMQASGAVLRFQGTFDILEETFVMSEVGVFAGNPGGIMVARTLFTDPLTHEYGENYPSADYAIHTLTS